MKEIKLKQGIYAQISDIDAYVSEYTWTSHKGRNTVYARSTHKGKWISMHRLILDITDPKVIIDHIDGDGLNNQRDNLRIATHSQNMANRKSKYKYLGVTPLGKDKKGWQVHCKKDNKVYTKYTSCETEGAIMYNELAIKLHGEFAKLNIIPEHEMQAYEKYKTSEVYKKRISRCNNLRKPNRTLSLSETEKYCARCEKVLHIDMFCNSKTTSYCKLCEKIRKRKYYKPKANKDKKK